MSPGVILYIVISVIVGVILVTWIHHYREEMGANSIPVDHELIFSVFMSIIAWPIIVCIFIIAFVVFLILEKYEERK